MSTVTRKTVLVFARSINSFTNSTPSKITPWHARVRCGSSPPGAAPSLGTACVHPLFPHPLTEVIGEVAQVVLSMSDDLGVTAEHGGDGFDAPLSPLGGFD